MTKLPYRELALKEAIERICAGERVEWLTLTDETGTYEVAVEFPGLRDKQSKSGAQYDD
jgi:hypothetical protein